MRKITIGLLLSTLVLTGCGYGRFVQTRAPNSCGGTGYAVAGVYYGDSRLAVVTITNLQPGAEFRVLLIPKRDDRPLPATATRDLQVTVQGKNAASSWITSMPASFNDRLSTGGLMAPICVPTTQGADDYYYMITVDEVGVLDPRARVN